LAALRKKVRYSSHTHFPPPTLSFWMWSLKFSIYTNITWIKIKSITETNEGIPAEIILDAIIKSDHGGKKAKLTS
jgi:hypothetical protein